MRGLLPVLLMAAAAAADPARDALEAAVAALRDDDPARRAEGARALAAIADETPSALAPLLDHPDLEVRGNAAALLEERGVFADPLKTQECRKLLDELSALEPGPARRVVLQAFLDLGAPAVALLASELDAEPDVRPVVQPARIAPIGVTLRVPLLLKNASRRGLWLNRGSVDAWAEWKPFGRRETGFRAGGGRFGVRSACGGRSGPEPTPEERVVDALAWMPRVAPGAEFELASAEAGAVVGGRVVVRAYRISSTRAVSVGEFHGRTLGHVARPVEALPQQEVAFVAEESVGDGFLARAVRSGGRWALELTALRDREPEPPDASYDSLWWLAEGAEGERLASGAFRDEPEEDAPWLLGETRVFPLTKPLPAGTRRLRLGYDAARGVEQSVAAPVEVSE